jgi:hypothetical protein
VRLPQDDIDPILWRVADARKVELQGKDGLRALTYRLLEPAKDCGVRLRAR